MARYPALGTLRERVTIQQESRAADGGGGAALTWAAITGGTDIAARVEPLSGRESLHAMAMEAQVSHRVTIRYLAGIVAGMRVLYGSRALNIRAAINIDERDRFIELACDEGVAT